MKRFTVLAGLATFAFGAPEAGAQMSQWVPPACKLNTKHFLVNSAQLYLKNATQAKNPEQKATNLKDAGRVLREAVTTGGQVDNPAVWYMYGRYYLLVDSLPAADSAFQKTEKSAPDCADDIAIQRRSAWVPNVQTAADALNKNDMATAKTAFRKANAIYQADPIGFYYLANVFINENEIDSAISYFRQTVAVANRQDTSQTEMYETSVFNMGRLYHQQQKWDSAAVWYERYRKEKPGDTQALTGLAVVYEASGDTARAARLYDDILTNADNVPTLDLFGAGIQLFRSNQYDRAALAFQGVLKKNPNYRDALYNLASTYLTMGSVHDTILVPKKEREALRASVRDSAMATMKTDSLTKARRDSASRAVGEKMLPVARRMVELDGQNRNTLRMLAVAYQYIGEQDSVLKQLERAEALPFEVNVLGFQAMQAGQQIQGTVTALMAQRVKQVTDSIAADSIRLDNIKKVVATGRDPKTNRVVPAAVKDALIKQQPVLEKRLAEVRGEHQKLSTVTVPPITFEFIDARGQVITSQTVAAMQLKPDGSQNFTLNATGEGIQGWRYKVGS